MMGRRKGERVSFFPFPPSHHHLRFAFFLPITLRALRFPTRETTGGESVAHQRQMSDTLRKQVPLPSSSVHDPVFPFNHSNSSLLCSVSNQSSFSVQVMPHHSFFASATIGSISNCVFTVHPRDPAGSTEENVAKRPRLDGSS